MAKIRPLDDRIVVLVSDAEEKTTGGIILPDTAKEKPQRGTVKSIGDGKLLGSGKRTPVAVRSGDTVIFGKYAGTDIKIGGTEFKILRENEILARIES